MRFFTLSGSSSQKSSIEQWCLSSGPKGANDCCSVGWSSSAGCPVPAGSGGCRLSGCPSAGDSVLAPCVADTAGPTPGLAAGGGLQGQQPGMAGRRSGTSTFPHTWHVQGIDEPLITPVWSPGLTRKGY